MPNKSNLFATIGDTEHDYYIPIHEAAVLLDCTPRHIQGRIAQGWFRYFKDKHGRRLVPKYVYLPDVLEVKEHGYVRGEGCYHSVQEAALLTRLAKCTLYKKIRHTGSIRWCKGIELQVHLQDAEKEAQNIYAEKWEIACK